MANTLQGEAEILAIAKHAGVSRGFNGDALLALRITKTLAGAPMREVLAAIPGGLKELLQNPNAHLV
jgi:hypothetical protein